MYKMLTLVGGVVIVILLYLLWKCRGKEPETIEKLVGPEPLDISKLSKEELQIRMTAIGKRMSTLGYQISGLTNYINNNPGDSHAKERLAKFKETKEKLSKQMSAIGERLSKINA